MLIILALVLLLIAFLAVPYYVYRVAFYSRKKGQDDIYNIPSGKQYEAYKEEMLELIRQLEKVEYEDVYVTSFDGLKLHGRYYHVKDGAPLNIGFHGYRATALRDFCVGANETIKRGHNLLLIDQRGQSKSQGNTITMGVKEHRDVLSWVSYAVKKFGSDTQIILYGVSMGAASVLMATAHNLPQNVKGVIADCPYNSPKDIILSVSDRDMGIKPKLAYPFVFLAARIFGRFDVNEITCENAVKNAKIPILIIHGEDDLYVPCEMSEAISDANKKNITRYTFAKAGHGISFFADKERYRRITEQFILECLDK